MQQGEDAKHSFLLQSLTEQSRLEPCAWFCADQGSPEDETPSSTAQPAPESETEQLRLERSSETIQCHPSAIGRELPQQRDGNSSWPHKCACWRASRVAGINNIYFNTFLLLCNHGGASWGCSSEESHTAPQDRVLAQSKV